MTADVEQLADGLDAALRAVGTPRRAIAEKRYLKSELVHYGATLGDLRETVRDVRTTRPDLGHDDLVGLVAALWREPVYERRAAAALLLSAYVRDLTPGDLALLERLIRESRTWALVDILAGDVAGSILVANPNAVDVLRRWAGDDDFWVRRSALLPFQHRPAAGRATSLPE